MSLETCCTFSLESLPKTATEEHSCPELVTVSSYTPVIWVYPNTGLFTVHADQEPSNRHNEVPAGSYSLGNQGHTELVTSLKPKYRSLLTLSHSRANLLLSICCVQHFTAVPLCWEGGCYVTPLQLRQDGTQLLDERAAAFPLLPAPRETEQWFCSSGSPPGCERRERNWNAFLC